MRKALASLALLTVTWLIPTSASAQSPAEFLRQAESYKVTDLHNPNTMRRHLNLYRQALAADPNSYDAAWKGARGALYVWRMTVDESEKRAVASLALDLARTAQKLNPQGSEGYFFAGMAFQAYAVSVGVLNVLQATPQVKAALDRSLALDPDFLYGAPHMYLGLLYHILPGFPLSIGNRQAALKHMELAVAARPQSPIRLMYYADILRTNRRFEEATKVLDSIEWTVKRDAERSVYESDYIQLPMAKAQAAEIRRMIEAEVASSNTDLYDKIPVSVVKEMLAE